MPKSTAVATFLALSLLSAAAGAGTITATGAVKALTNVTQLHGVVGNGNFDEGPTSGAVPLGVYSAAGLTWQTGTLSTILPGCANTGAAGTGPQYGTWNYFPGPIGGGGVHNGQSNNFAGVATFSVTITQVGLVASTNGQQFLTVWNKAGAYIGEVTWVPASDSAFVGIDSLGVPIGMVAYGPNSLFPSNTAYTLGGATNISDSWVWASGTCTSDAQCDDGNPCTDDSCTIATGVCVHIDNKAPCSTGKCSMNDTCSGGTCQAGTPVVCAPLDQCHTAGICAPATGVCSNPTKADGTTCDDANACTQTDTCTAGVCTGTNPVTCTALDQCHAVGACTPATGMCTNPSKADGTACSNNSKCSSMDTCMAGVCTGMNPVMCPPSDQCHTAGTCDMTTGMCSNPAKPDGTTCDDGNACTQADTCAAGVCAGANPVTCTAMDQCHDVGMCDPTTGMCSRPNKMDGAMCDDGNKCTQSDTCSAGVCTGSNPMTCAAMDACHTAGTCDPTAGACSNPSAADGTACPGGSCKSGVCTPTQMGTGGSGAGTGGSGAGTGGSGAGTGGSAAGTGGSGAGTGGSGGGVHAPGAKSGCGCVVAESSNGAAPGAALLLLFALRRRSRAGRPSKA